MKHTLVAILSLPLLTILSPFETYSQQNKPDSLYYQAAIETATAYYFTSLKEQSGLYAGRMNVPYNFSFETGIPFFTSTQFINGTIFYDGLLYKNVPLLFDQISNTVITLFTQGRLNLMNEKIKYFDINGHSFVRIVIDSLNNNLPGFYERLYTGKIEVLLKVKKTIREELVSGTGVVRYVDEKDYYYLRQDNKYLPVQTKKELLQFFGSKKQEIQQFLKRNKLNVKKNLAETLVRVADYYDQLSR